jgi:hypothetical protein
MLIHLPIVILASLHSITVANIVPQFDIVRECRAEGDTTEMRQRCTDDEVQSRKQLQAEWTQFSPGAIAQCTGETSIDGTPSYVELQTCLEMERDVRVERKAETSKQR